MGRRGMATTALAVALLAAVLAGCGPRSAAPSTTTSPSEPTPTDATSDESGPDSPIAYGFQVPRGASQVGPLIRYRSDRLINAYQPQLDAAQARHDADRQRRRDEAEAKGSPIPAPTPTPTTTPTSETFKLLADPPKPDVTISLMRVTGAPTSVVRAMLAQIDVILPKAGIVRSDISRYCAAKYRRVLTCHVEATGTSPAGRRLAVTLDVDTGDLETRTAPPSSNLNPVMALRVEYIGDPRAGQTNRQGDSNIRVPSSVKAPDRSGLIWPRMDIDARRSSALLNGWRAPKEAHVLLSSYHPAWVVMSTERALDASSIAGSFARSIQAEPKIDVVEDLNEITTTYTAVGPDGEQALANYILSARGYYAVLFWSPPPAPEGTPVPAATN